MADADVAERMGPELELLLPLLDERARRLVLGAVARAAGRGGTGAVARVSGASWQTVAGGVAELTSGQVAGAGRVRRAGGGRKSLAQGDPGLVPALLALVEDSTRGDPCSPLRWTTRSLAKLSRELAAAGHRCSAQTAGRLLAEAGFSLQANAKTIEGRQHPDRDAQFRYIAARASECLAAGEPVISVDAKKKEQVGQYAHAGAEWRPAGDPVAVRDHDFPDEQAGKVTPYGVYDLAANDGFVNVGTDHDTAAFAVESIRCWWNTLGKDRYPGATRLLITADAGGSNGYRTRAWKTGLAALAAQTGLEITCCHFPPGTSKWNKIEHRLFSQITRNWRARPLTSHQVIVSTIAATTTTTGLAVTAALDTSSYPRGVKITAAQLQALEDSGALTWHEFHPAWNYTMHPDPAPAPPPPPDPAPPAPAADPRSQILDTLARPELTGMTRDDFARLAADLEVPAAAAREQRLHLARGHPRTTPARAPGPGKLPHPARLAATILRQRYALPLHALAYLFGVSTDTITPAIKTTSGLLTQHNITITPGPRLTTLDSFRDYTAAAGITIPSLQGANPHE
jgi:Rhodopirellula transposase DDE domain